MPTHAEVIEQLIAEKKALQERLALCMSFLTYSALLASHIRYTPSLKEERVQSFMENVSPGDLVMERTTIGDRVHDDRRIGWLVWTGHEPIHTDEEWEEAVAAEEYNEDDQRPTERVYRIRTITGQEIRWVNASFIRLPANYYEQERAITGPKAFETARRCPDCGTVSYAPAGVAWSQFDQKLGCNRCRGEVGRLLPDGTIGSFDVEEEEQEKENHETNI